jgi:O-antigen ligase
VKRAHGWSIAAVALAALGGLASSQSAPLTVLALMGFVAFLAVSQNRPGATALLFPLAFIPFAVNLFPKLVGPSDFILMLLGGALLLEWVTDRPSGTLLGPLAVPAIGFIAWTAASSLWAANPAAVLGETIQRASFVGLGLAVVHTLPSDGRAVRRGLTGMVAMAAVMGAVETIAAIASGHYFAVYALGIHKNWYGFVLAFGLIVLATLAGEGRRPLTLKWLIPLVPMVTGVVTSGSRGGWIGTLVGLTVVVIFQRPSFAWPAVTAAVLVAGIAVVAAPQLTTDKINTQSVDTTTGMRMATWSQGMKAVKAHPVFGEGAGNFVAVVENRGAQVDPNNLTLLTWAETGIFGVLLLGWLILGALRMAARNSRVLTGTAALANTAGCALFVSAIAHAQFDIFWTRGVALLTFMGMGLVLWANRQADHSVPDPTRSLVELGAL